MIRKIWFSAVFAACGLNAGAQLLSFQRNYHVGYKDPAGTVVVDAVYDAGSEMKEGMAIIMKGNKRGYLGANGKELIPCIFDDASLFEKGLACVQWQGKYGFINPAGEWVLPAIYDNAFIHKNGLARVSKNQKWGMIDQHGTMVVPMIYDRLYDCSDGLIAASIDGKHFGYLDPGGKVVLDFRFTLTQPFDPVTHKAVVSTQQGNYHINRAGRIIDKLADEEEQERREREPERHRN